MRVFLSTPVQGAVKENLELARRLVLYHLALHNHPVCPHLFLIRAVGLEEGDASIRAFGIDYGLSELATCDECHIFLRQDETLSPGCAQEQEFCRVENIPYSIQRWPDFLMRPLTFSLTTARALVTRLKLL